MTRYKHFLSLIKYKITSRHKFGYGIHSPFVFDLIKKVFIDKTTNDIYHNIEKLRKKLLRSDKKLVVKDYGSGSKVNNSNSKLIKFLVRYSAVNKKYGQLLSRLITYFKPNTIIELGTNLGFSTAYLALAAKNTKIYTIEGCPETAKEALENFKSLKISNIILNVGEFKKELPGILNKVKKDLFVFIDGHHEKESTLSYFEQCLTRISTESVIVIDDIHLSPDMEEAWKIIKKHPDTKLTIDIFRFGIVFFKYGVPKQHFTIRF